MNTWKKMTAVTAAGLLGLAAFGTVLAATGPSTQGVTPTLVAGNIQMPNDGGPHTKADCLQADAILTGNSSGSGTSENGVTVVWTYNATTKAFSFTASGGVVTIAYIKGGDDHNKYDYTGFTGGGVTSDGNMFAPDNESGPAGLSHAIFCTGEGTSETDEPSFEQSQEAETDEPSFEDSFAAETDVPTEPPTNTIGGGTSGPADGAWLLVVALGVFLASVVVLTPARAKSR